MSLPRYNAQRGLFPFGLPDLLLEMKRTQTVAVNGVDNFPEHQGHGGNALLYYAMASVEVCDMPLSLRSMIYGNI